MAADFVGAPSLASAPVDMQPAVSYRAQYENKCELLLVLVGYAVGLGNIWRFPYLCFENGGGAFLIAYAVCLALLGLPLFILELGLGQMFRKGTMHIWQKMGVPKLRCIGVCATICTFAVSLYYCVILGWTILYLGEIIASIPSGTLPWSDLRDGYSCPPNVWVTTNSTWCDSADGTHEDGVAKCRPNKFTEPENDGVKEWFVCGVNAGNAHNTNNFGANFSLLNYTQPRCPGQAAIDFWNNEALRGQSTSMENPNIFKLGGINWKLFVSFTLGWIVTYFCVFQGVASSGKIVYFTALMPYVALTIFVIRALTLDGMSDGIRFYLSPDFTKLGEVRVWARASTQIFYSLGCGFGSLIAFASFSDPKDDFIGNAFTVSLINAGTSFYGGFAVFPILGFLALEMSKVNECFKPGDIEGLKDIGVQASGLVFVAFPIAISKFGNEFLNFCFAFLFFLMLLCLGIDSQFAMVESVITVLNDQGIGKALPKPTFAAIVCGISWFCGLIFTTKAGIYWFNLFDYFTCVIVLFIVCLLEVVGVMYLKKSTWSVFKEKVHESLGRAIPSFIVVAWAITPLFLLFLVVWNFVGGVVLLDGPEYHPVAATNLLGWFLGCLPLMGMGATFAWDSLQTSKKPDALALPEAMELAQQTSTLS